MSGPEDEEEIEFASPPCSLSELDPEFAGLTPRKVEKAKGKRGAHEKGAQKKGKPG